MKQMMRVKVAIMAAGLVCVGLVFGTEASASDKNACSEDIAKFCQGIKPGMIATMDCLEKHENELTGECKAHEATMGGGRVESKEMVREKIKFRQACLNDMAKFCKDANPTQGGMLKCLNDHGKEISVPCSKSTIMMMGQN